MFLRYLKFYLRSMSKRKLFSFINITGLAFGIGFMLLIGEFIYYEFSYNCNFSNIENIYRLINVQSNDYNIDYRMKDQILTSIPGVKNACLINHAGVEISISNKSYQIENMLIVDVNFFEMFNTSFVAGNLKDALNSVDNVVLTETTAKNIFGTTNVIGKIIRFNHTIDMMITGIVKDLPKNTSFKADLFVSSLNCLMQRLSYKMNCKSYDSNIEYNSLSGKDDRLCQYLFNVFVELGERSDIDLIEKQISNFNKLNNFRYPKKVSLSPMKYNYLNTRIQESDLLHGNLDLIKLLSVVGLIILLLAVINYVNLTTASYRNRMKEIGVKKCFGVNRATIIRQLLFESFFTCFLSALLGIIIAELFMPYFSRFVDNNLSLQLFNDIAFLSLFISFILFLSAFAGLLPSMILSRISPIQLVTSTPYSKSSGKIVRGFLTTVQFSISIILIAGLIFINRQINYVKHKDLGFNTNKLINLKVPNSPQVLVDKLLQYQELKLLSKTMGIPGEIDMSMNGYETMIIDSSTSKVFGFNIIRGRNLFPSDVNKACLINFTAFKQLKDDNYKDHKINGSEIVGVVSDFHYSSLYNKTGPLVLMYNPAWGANNITIRISGSIDVALSHIKQAWKEACPDYILNYSFYDDFFASMYKKEENLASLVNMFSILAIIISGLGIFGLSVFQSEQRIKEIGIRKVLGATAIEITFLLTKSFSKWVLYANIVAFPIAYYFVDKWLQDFAYRINISWWVFALSGGIALLIALITVSFHAVKAATANPIEALRYE
jgi:putative ABC transport system permease protein